MLLVALKCSCLFFSFEAEKHLLTFQVMIMCSPAMYFSTQICSFWWLCLGNRRWV